MRGMRGMRGMGREKGEEKEKQAGRWNGIVGENDIRPLGAI